MDSRRETKCWPTIAAPSDLFRLGAEITSAIRECERTWASGAGQPFVADDRVSTLLGPMIVSVYEKPAPAPTEELARIRAKWVESALQEFGFAWLAPVVEFDSRSGDDSGTQIVHHPDGETPMRHDQIASARYWGIGIRPREEASALGLATFVLRRAMSRLSSNLSCVSKLCRAYAENRLHPEAVRWASQGFGVSFEHLAADLLNEDVCRATHAPLYENLFEWTDLRVRYPDLQRKHGARVQVKLIGDQSLHAEKMERCRDLKSYVVLSPLELARHVEAFFEAGDRGAIEAGFWECLGSHPADCDELANALLRVFTAAIQDPRRHPLGPLIRVPAPIRALVRSFVKAGSFGATKHVREVLDGRLEYVPRWVSRFSQR